MAGRWVPLAEVARPHGVWGEVRLKVYNSDSDLLFSQTEVLVQAPDRKDAMMQLESVRGADTGYLLAKFRGVDGRDAADHLRGAAVCVERDRFPELDEGEFYVCDVIGARLVGPRGGSSNGHPLGEVADFVSYPSADVLSSSSAASPETQDRAAAHRRLRRARRHGFGRSGAPRGGARLDRGGQRGNEASCRLTSSRSFRGCSRRFSKRAWSGAPPEAASFACAPGARVDFGIGRHLKVDDTPYGGGTGMVMRVECLVACMESLDQDREGGALAHRVLLTPQGRPLSQMLLRGSEAAQR